MTRLEKIQLAINNGFTYNSETGKIYGIKGKEIIGKCCEYIAITLRDENKKFCSLKGHQFAWYIVNKEIVKELDHINRDRSDNRICNLRSVTRNENQFNKDIKEYSFNKKLNKFVSRIALNYKQLYLGLFDNENEARQAYLDAKEIYHTIKNKNKII